MSLIGDLFDRLQGWGSKTVWVSWPFYILSFCYYSTCFYLLWCLLSFSCRTKYFMNQKVRLHDWVSTSCGGCFVFLAGLWLIPDFEIGVFMVLEWMGGLWGFCLRFATIAIARNISRFSIFFVLYCFFAFVKFFFLFVLCMTRFSVRFLDVGFMVLLGFFSGFLLVFWGGILWSGN